MAIRAVLLASLLAGLSGAVFGQESPHAEVPGDSVGASLECIDGFIGGGLEDAVGNVPAIFKAIAIAYRQVYASKTRDESRADELSWILDASASFCKELFEEYPSGEALAIVDAAKSHRAAGRYKEAESIFRAGLQQLTDQGASDMDIAICLDGLAWNLNMEGKWAEAESAARRTLHLAEKHRADSSWGSLQIQALDMLGEVEFNLGHLQSAAKLAAREVVLAESTRGASSQEASAGLMRLGVVQEKLGQHDLAATSLERALKIEDAASGDNVRRIRALERLATVQFYRREYAEAEALYAREMTLLKARPAEAREILEVTESLGAAKLCLKKYGEGERLIKEALAEREKLSDVKGPRYLMDLVNLALSYSEQGRNAEAIPYADRALAIVKQRSIGGAVPTDLLQLWGKTIEIYQKAGKDHEAEGLYLDLISRLEATKPRNPMVEAKVLANYSEYLRNSGRPHEAAEVRIRAERMHQEALAAETPI